MNGEVNIKNINQKNIEYCVYMNFIPMNATVKTFLMAILWIVSLSINTSIDTVLKDTVRGPLHVEQSSKVSFTLWVCVISLCGLVEHEAIKTRQIEMDGHVEALNGFIWAVTHVPFHQGIYRSLTGVIPVWSKASTCRSEREIQRDGGNGHNKNWSFPLAEEEGSLFLDSDWRTVLHDLIKYVGGLFLEVLPKHNNRLIISSFM